jgi:hypothetical protein
MPAPGAVDYCGFLDPSLRGVYTSTHHNSTTITVRNKLALDQLTNLDGASNTIMQAHKGMDPRDYLAPTRNMGHNAYWTGASSYGHDASEIGNSRAMSSPQRDFIDPTPDTVYDASGCSRYSNNVHHQSQKNCRICNTATGSPHGAMPTLWCDASVRHMRYGVPQAIYQSMIFYRDGTPIPGDFLQ